MRPKTGHCHKAKYILIHNSRTYELRFAKILIHKLFYFSADLKIFTTNFSYLLGGEGRFL